MALDRHEFTRRFLGETIDVTGSQTAVTQNNVSDGSLPDGLVIKCAPLFKSTAQRLKGTLVKNAGPVDVYLNLEGQMLKAGSVNLNFATFSEINQIISTYQPQYTRVEGGQEREFSKLDLIDTAELPKLEQRDYYMR